MRAVISSFLAVTLVSCAGGPHERDDLCDELARFANAATGPFPRTVSLITDWALREDPDDPSQLVFGTKACTHGDVQAGRVLCSYLLENTSTEFAVVNFKRALRCLGMSIPVDAADAPQLPDSVKTCEVLGKRLDGELTVTFLAGDSQTPPLLEISVKQPSDSGGRLTSSCSGP